MDSLGRAKRVKEVHPASARHFMWLEELCEGDFSDGVREGNALQFRAREGGENSSASDTKRPTGRPT